MIIEQKDPAEYRLKKYEELYSYSKVRLSEERARFERIDTKVSRYISVITVILGLFAIGIGPFIEVCERAKNFQDWGFIIGYGALAFTLFSAVVMFFWALRLQDLRDIKFDNNLIDFFDRNRYVTVLYAISREIVKDFQHNNNIIKHKIAIARRGYNCVVGIMIITPLTVGFYLWSSLTTSINQ